METKNEQAEEAPKMNDQAQSVPNDTNVQAGADVEGYAQAEDTPDLTEAEEAERQTGRPTGAIYGQDGDIMYVSDTFQDGSDADDTNESTDTQTEGNP